MSQIDYYYGRDPRSLLPHHGGLKAWGIVLIVFGALAGVFALLALAFAVMMTANLVPGAQRQDPLALLAGIGMYVVAAVVLIWLGIGSLKGQRWVRPLIMVATSLILSSGVISAVPLSLSIIRFQQHPTRGPAGQPNFELIGLAVGGCFAAIFLIAFPAVMLWFYGRASVQHTLDVLDPRRHWTDRCPLPVLGWSITCVILGVMLAAAGLHGIFPCFTAVLVGAPAYLAITMWAVLLIAGGIVSYLQNPLGWLISFAAVVTLGVSYAIFSFLGNQQLFIDLTLQNLPAASRQTAEPFAHYALLGPVLMYAAAAVYAIWIRKRFGETVSVPEFSA